MVGSFNFSSVHLKNKRGRVERERRSKIGSGELLARERACRRRSPSNYRKRCWSFASLSSPLTSALSELLFRSHPWRICFWSKSAVVWGFGALAPFDLTKKKKKTFVVQDVIEDLAESHGRHTIRCLIVQEEFIGYIAEHPNDEEDVEGIDLHQQCYPCDPSLRAVNSLTCQNHNAVSVVSEITKLAMCQDIKSISADG
ncbi:hypothetical protein F2Q69_00062117 [Brassica cretica]|uniref:Uncharacterized protein n=1 Tax=Brassica cretica TaxID=69181 RepID=A0A8S9RM59_BRACR|nr:hypothetical protein F2Q69_00062117 [Brassica cretica]